MRLSLALVLALAVACRATLYLQDGKEYHFDTEVSASAGTMDYATHTSGFSFRTKVRMQVSGRTMNIQMNDNIEMSQFVGAHDANKWAFDGTNYRGRSTRDFRQPKPISITLDSNGLFESLVVPSDADANRINMAKAWAAQFQMNSGMIKQGKMAFKSKEELIQGHCNVTYTVTGDKVIKSVAHMSDCEGHMRSAMRKSSNYGFHKCDSSEPENPPSVATTTFVLKPNPDGSKQIAAIVATSTYVAQKFEEEGAAYLVYTNATYKLTDVKSSSGDIRASGNTIRDLSYDFDDANLKWDAQRDLKKPEESWSIYGLEANQAKEKVRRIIDEQARIMSTLSPDKKETIENAHKYGIDRLNMYLGQLSHGDLMGLAGEYLGDKTEVGMMKGNIFGESLSSAGTAPSALAVLDLVLAERFDNDRDAARILSSVPFHLRRPNKQLVEKFEKLLTTRFDGRFTAMAARLTFGHMVRQTCKQAGTLLEIYACSNDIGKKYQRQFYNDFKNTADHSEKLHILTSMQNMAFGSVAELLKPLIFGQTEEKCQVLRNAAMWAASTELIVTKKGAEYLRPIFADTSLGHEMRLSALELMFMSKPTAADMTSVMVVLFREPDFEVLNYAMTLIERYAQSIDPCEHDMANMCAYYLKYMKQYSNYQADWGLGASKTYQRQYYQKRYGYGGTYGFYVVGSEQSTMPVAVGMWMGGTLGTNYETSFISVHLNIQGLSKMMVRKLKQTDPSTWKTDDLKKVLTDMSIRERPDQKVRAMISIKVKGITVFSRSYDEDDFSGEGKIGSFMKGFMGLGDEYSLNHQRAIRLGDFVQEMPTNIGVPMYLYSSMTSLVSLKAQVKRGNVRGLLFRDITYKLNVFTQGSRALAVMNPSLKTIYGISQDRIYHMKAPRNIVVGVNPIKREVKLSVSRPPHDDPMQLLMHSHTKVWTAGMAASKLKDNCPDCEQSVVVSRGPDAIDQRAIIDRENQKRGAYLKAAYFDCEMDIRRRNTFGRGLAAFMPYNKSPKTPWTMLSMGVRQIRDFFFYYPRNEQCGMFVRWSQSKNNPVTGIEISLRGNVEPNGSKQFFNGRKWFIKALVKAKGEPQDRTYRINIAYEFSPSNVYNKLKVQINRAPIPELNIQPYSVCAAYESKFPDLGKEFISFEPDKQLENTGKGMVQYGEGSSCSETDGEIRLKFKHSTTDYAQKDLKNKWYYKQCMEQKNNVGWKGHEGLPVSEPCYMAIWDSAMARKYSWNIEFVKLSQRMKSIISKFRAAVSAGLMPYWDLDPETLDADGDIGPFMNIDVEFKHNEKNADVSMETSQGKKEYTDVPLSLEWTKRLRQLKYSKSLVDLYYSKIISPCVVSTGDIRTMDNVTLTYDAPTCWTLASATCGPDPHYAVFSKKSGDGLAVRAYFGGHLVEMSPNGGVKINGSPVNVPDGGQHTETSAGTEIFKLYRWGNSYNIHSMLRLWVTYDGHYVQVIPAPSTKGQHCGICGNYNRNPKDELTGRNMEHFKTVQEFVSDWKEKC